MALSGSLQSLTSLFDPLSDEFFPRLALLPPAPSVGLLIDSGSSNTDLLTNDLRLAITSVAGATLEYSFDGINWSATPPGALPDGNYTIKVRQTVAGETSTATDFTFSYDATAPDKLTIKLTNDTGSDATDHITTDSSTTIGNQENGAVIEYSIDNGVTWTSTAPANLVPGDYTILARQVDLAGNASDPASLTFTLTTANGAPVLALTNDTGSSQTDHITNDAHIDVTGILNGGSITYFIDGDVVGVSALPSSWIDGDHTVVARQTGADGENADATFTFTLDTVAPDVLELALKNDTGALAIDNITTDATLDITGLETGAIVEYSLDGGKTWSKSAPSGLAAGDYTVDVRQTDVAGNVSDISSLTFTLLSDTIPGGHTGTGLDGGNDGRCGNDMGW